MEQHYAEWQQQLVKCIRCGTCRSVCPVFQASDNENTTARGKVKLLEAVSEGKLALTPELQARMSKCLLCKACAPGCPSGVRTDELFLSARRALAAKNGLPIAKKLAFTGLTYRKLFDLGLKMGAAFQGVVFKDAPDGRGKLARFPLPGAGLSQRRIIPPLAATPLRSRLPETSKVASPKARVAFYTGCMLNYVYPESGEAIVKILKAHDVEVVIPARQSCCGTPAFTSGDYQVGRYLAEENVKVLAAGGYDAIITGCASCGAALKHEYGAIIEDPAVKTAWESLAAKVKDITQFVAEVGLKQDLREVKAKITYHDPCHLVRGMGVTKEPRQLLKAIPGVEYAEMKDAAKCCGAGGTFSMAYYDIARTINDWKLDNAEKTGAGILATGCSACRMHITDGLGQRGSGMRVLHTAEIIAQAYGLD
ncbi:Glycolate oxidase iron-sulfur subunit [uncultured Sporomusa sp.]|uniref:Glycolate oxidase iron-sulfur subunit n=1 Tax=uncultured Sporomusa sp. TaxID=307249 RepID=A0A212LWP4_9FIRM|nr:(Fe-S)-binding protein [uncultured Sporomusa sp.]SCM82034.1 Glycolate oxidase iron-sulfur subunit [uncultured Sporomusa sp.]